VVVVVVNQHDFPIPGLPDPTSIERQKNAYARGLEEQLRRSGTALAQWQGMLQLLQLLQLLWVFHGFDTNCFMVLTPIAFESNSRQV
jgi:hypothetical protein